LKKIDLLKKIEEAKIKQKAGNSLEANQIFQVLLKSNNDSFDLLYAYGLFCRDLKNFNLAKRVFLNLINKFPSSINSYILLAEILKIEPDLISIKGKTSDGLGYIGSNKGIMTTASIIIYNNES